MKVTLKDQNADHSGPTLISPQYRKRNFALRRIRSKKEKSDKLQATLRDEVVLQKPINKFMIRPFRNLGGLNQKMGECDNFFFLNKHS